VQRRVLLILGLTFVLLSPFVAPAVAGSSASITLSLAPPSVTYGHAQTASGTINADTPPCAAGRTVDLEQEPPGSTTWSAPIASTTSGSDGGFSFSEKPQATEFYRAVAEADVPSGCVELDSIPVKGVVLAAVTLALGRTSLGAGNCAGGTVKVRPAKAGQKVLVQEHGGSGWQTVQTLMLDGSSRAAAKLCYGWGAIGAHSLRARWKAQDTANATGTSTTRTLSVVEAGWMRHIDHLAGGRAVGVSIRALDHVLYERQAMDRFAPASNMKLLLSMALLDRLGPRRRIDTAAAVPSVRRGVVHGNLWILGHGDPSTGLPELTALARQIARAGVRRIAGRVMGSTGYFARDWFAPGWRRDFPRLEVGLPSALTFKENHVDGRNVRYPESFAAKALTAKLVARGVKVGGRPSAGAAPGGLDRIAQVESAPLTGLMRHMDRLSDNFFAEVLGKGLAVDTAGPPGTIARGAGAIATWTRAHGVGVVAHDSSGLSFWDRVTPDGITTLLQTADHSAWGTTLRGVLPAPGQGTLEGRLGGVRLHAKTGTLDYVSALSGWVWLSQLGTWGEFSILDRGMSYSAEKSLEDAIVRTMASYAH
jgi:D-alanyl-D-alanine carboxypeptidase